MERRMSSDAVRRLLTWMKLHTRGVEITVSRQRRQMLVSTTSVLRRSDLAEYMDSGLSMLYSYWPCTVKKNMAARSSEGSRPIGVRSLRQALRLPSARSYASISRRIALRCAEMWGLHAHKDKQSAP